MAFSNTLQLTTVCAVSASPALTTVFRLSSNNSVWQSTLPLEAPTFLWQVSASYTGGWQNFTTWTSQTTSFLLTAAVYDSLHNFRLLENRRNSTVSLTSVGPSFSRSLTLTNLPSSENIELWLDATKGLFNGLSSLNVDNSTVALWGDLSRKERNPIQTVVNNLPVLKTSVQNGNNVLRFNGTSQFLEIPNSTSMFNFLHNGTKGTIFMVVKAGVITNPDTFYLIMANNSSNSSNSGMAIWYEDRSSLSYNNQIVLYVTRSSSGTTSVFSTTPANTFISNQYNLAVFEIDPANVTPANRSTVYVNLTGGPYQNNVSSGSPSNNNSRSMFIGAGGGYFLGDLCEIIIYRGILTPSERSTVENYLKTKWGTP